MRIIYVAIAVLALAACNREGPMEKAGRAVDKAGEKASESIEKAAKSARDAVTPDKK
jgi:predicted small lipoprotein YifL